MIDVYRTLGAYIPYDRSLELYGGRAVPTVGTGSVLFADIVGFTTLTTRLCRLYGARRGAEEVLVYLNRVYEAIEGAEGHVGGHVIGFAGDALTLWLDGDDGELACHRAMAMQRAMNQFENLSLDGSSETISLALKVAVTAGTVRRFAVGDPSVQLIDVIAGQPVAQIEELEPYMRKGEVVVSSRVAGVLNKHIRLRPVDGSGPRGATAAWLGTNRVAIIDVDRRGVPVDRNQEAGDALIESWVLPTVRRRLLSGGGHFLTEIRPVAALFLAFDGIDIDNDSGAPTKFDKVVRVAQEVAKDYGGNVLQVTSGDKGSYLYMAFGAPVSHEDDVQRCAAAALDLRRRLLQLEFLSLVTIGLGYGTARTGAYGSRERRTYGALGEGTNMAARMMSVAPHGHIYVSGELADAAGRGFEFRQLEGLMVKGRAEPVRAFELLHQVNASTYATQVQPTPGNRLRGREEELGVLSTAIVSAAHGKGQIVQLVAEAGMGKTELLRHALTDEDSALRVVRGACQAFGLTAPYQLWRSVFHQLLGVSESLTAAERLLSVEQALTSINRSLTTQAHLLIPVLDLPQLDGPAQGAEERDAARRSLLLTLFRHQARATHAAGRTLVLVLEDLHWIDPTSEELLRAVGQAATALPVLLLTSCRPAEVAGELPMGALEQATTVELGPLGPEAARDVVAARLADAHLGDKQAASLTEVIVRRAGGNPFYLQELVTDVLQRVRQHGSSTDPTENLPTSVHSLILGRLDRLHDDHLVNLKVASIVGREFLSSWVAACQQGGSAVQSEAAFAATDGVGLTNRLASQPPLHEFNHAITHEVTYGSQVHADKTRLHTALARFVEAEVATPDEPHLDLLAYHYALGDDTVKARQYLGAAGAAAKAAYANQAALDYLGRLLALQSGNERLPALLELGEVAMFVGSYSDAKRYLVEALELAGGSISRAVALRLLGELHERQGDHTAARGPLEEAANLCRAAPDRQAELTRVLLALGGNVLWHLGEYDEAERQLDEAVQLARTTGDVRAAARALHGKANIHLDRGQSTEAEAALTESLAMRRAANDEYGVAQALNNLAIVHAGAGDGAKAEELFAESLTIRQRLGDVSGVAVALNNLGYMAAERSDLEGARRLYEQSLAARRELGDRLGLAVSLNNLGGLVLDLGELQEARQYFGESLDLACSIDNRREAAAALAGMSNAAPDDASAVCMAMVAERLLELLGAAVDDEVRVRIDKGKGRNPGATAATQLPDLAAMTLSQAVDWATRTEL